MVATATGPLVGRVGEREELRRVLDDAVAGRGRVVFLEGEAGIGKSRLLAEAVAIADQLGFQVLAGAAEELASTRPFGPLYDALDLGRDTTDPARRQIGRLLRGEGPHDDGSVLLNTLSDLRFQVVEEILDLIEALASDRPVALVLDDLQWADQATLLTVLEVGRRLSSVSVAVLGSYRPAPRRPDIDRVVVSLPGALHVVLAPLAGTDVAELVEQLLAAPPGPRLLAEVEGGGGNPLYVTELVRALQEEGDLDWARGSVEMARTELPRNLRLTILRRLGFLPPSTLELMQVAAVLGTTFALDDLSVVLGRTTAQLLPDLQEGVRAGVLGEVGARLAFRHDLLRDALYQDLPAPVRMQLHREAGRALAAADAPAERVARHLAIAAEPGDLEVIDWLQRAAAEAGSSAPATAAELLDRALALLPPGADDRPIRAERARALIWAGRLKEGAAEAEALLEEQVSGSAAVDVRSALALALLFEGRLSDAVAQLEAVTEHPDLPPEQRWHLVAEAALGRLLTGDREAAVREAELALNASLVDADELACSLALSTLAWAHHDRGELGPARDLATSAVQHAERAGPEVVGRYASHFFLGTVLTASDRYEEAQQVFAAGRSAAEATGAVTVLTVHHVAIAMLANATGQWDDAVAELEAGIALGEALGTTLGLTWHWSVWAQIALHRGERERAREMLDRAEEELLRVGPQFGVDWMMWGRALLVEPDDPARALAILENCWDVYHTLGVLQPVQTIGPDLARLAVQRDARERAETTARGVERIAAIFGTTSCRVAALRCRASVDADPSVALAALEAARSGVRSIDVAFTCEEAALALRDAGHKREAAPLLEEALGHFEQLGAASDVARVGAALPSVGSRRRARAAPRPAFGWKSLTRSERTIVDLVARGLTNRQIALQLSVSRRTVETHLTHVFTKLALASRVELATAAAMNPATA